MGNIIDGCCKSKRGGDDVNQDEVDELNGGITTKSGQDT